MDIPDFKMQITSKTKIPTKLIENLKLAIERKENLKKNIQLIDLSTHKLER